VGAYKIRRAKLNFMAKPIVAPKTKK